MWLTTNLSINGKIEGKDETSLFKVLDNSTGNSGAQIKGNISFCDLNGNEFPSWANIIKSGVTENCDFVVPTSECNPEGNGGTPQIVDGDGDGVADDLDEYPTDPARAANRYYPSATGTATLAFEDLWPNYGDYDFNDMVVDYRYQFVLNASNNVVDLKGDFTTVALGGSFNNGFGVQLGIASSSVNSVTGTSNTGAAVTVSSNGTEAGQTNATIIVFDEAETFMPNTTGASFVNTISSNSAVTPATANVVINFSSPVTESSLGNAPFNPFIFIDQDRGREVHLAGQQPTSLANNSFFGTGKDDTQTGGENTYKSIDNLPWAININGTFMHPEEKEELRRMHFMLTPLLLKWATSRQRVK
jgi:LruC domain-containing protein